MNMNTLAYRRGVADALDKFAAAAGPTVPGMTAAGGLSSVPPLSTSVPGMPSAAVKPGAPNQALSTTPTLGTGVAPTPTLAGMGKTQTQGAVVSAPAPAAPPTPSTSKAASLFAPTKAPRAAKIPVQKSTIGSNNTVETAKSVAPSSSSTPSSSTSSTASSSSAPAAAGAAGPQMGGIVPTTGQSPAATLANETASNTRNQVVSVSGGGK